MNNLWENKVFHLWRHLRRNYHNKNSLEYFGPIFKQNEPTLTNKRRHVNKFGFVLALIEPSDVAAHLGVFFGADTTDVLSATKAADGGIYIRPGRPAVESMFWGPTPWAQPGPSWSHGPAIGGPTCPNDAPNVPWDSHTGRLGRLVGRPRDATRRVRGKSSL